MTTATANTNLNSPLIISAASYTRIANSEFGVFIPNRDRDIFTEGWVEKSEIRNPKSEID